MVSAVVPGTGTVTFKYDPFGRRIQKSGPLGATNYIYDRMNSLEEVDNAGNVLAKYAHGAVVDEDLAMLRNGTASYYNQDGLGSVTSLGSSNGTLAQTYAFDSFGKLTASTGTLTNPFQYTGREFDSETGIYYYRARYFDPSAGRFLSQDPIGFSGGVNHYAYTRNSPVVLRDSYGYQGCVSTPQTPCRPTAPDAPYQGPDGLWYNVITEWHNDPAPLLPDLTPPPAPGLPPPPSTNCKCKSKNLEWRELSNEEALEALAKATQIAEAGGDVLLGAGLAVGGTAGEIYLCVETGGLACVAGGLGLPAFVVGGYELTRGGLNELDEAFSKDCE
jgi:RHS repeat-associated protein